MYLISFIFIFLGGIFCCSIHAETAEDLQKRLQPQFIQLIDKLGKQNPKAFVDLKQYEQEVKLCIQENPANVSFQNGIGIIFAEALKEGLGEAAMPRLLDLRMDFYGKSFSHVRQGVDIIILQILYKSNKWQDGFHLISEEATNSIVHPELIEGIEGFCSGAANAGKSKESCQAYAALISNLSNIQDGIHTPGDCLLRFSHINALNKDQNSRLAALNRIEQEYPAYYKQHEPTIHWFKYATYVELGKQIEAVAELEATAKLLSNSNSFDVDPSILEALPTHLKIYQKAGWLSKDLKIQVEADSNNKVVRRDESALIHSARTPLIIIMFISLSSLGFIVLMQFRHKARLGHK